MKSAKGRKKAPWVEARPREDGSFDELVAKNVEMMHFEMLDDNVLWIGIYQGDRTYHVTISARGKLTVNHHEC